MLTRNCLFKTNNNILFKTANNTEIYNYPQVAIANYGACVLYKERHRYATVIKNFQVYFNK